MRNAYRIKKVGYGNPLFVVDTPTTAIAVIFPIMTIVLSLYYCYKPKSD